MTQSREMISVSIITFCVFYPGVRINPNFLQCMEGGRKQSLPMYLSRLMTTRWRMEAVLVSTSTLNQMKHS